MLNINRATLSQNFLGADQFKCNCLAIIIYCTINYIWEDMKARKRLYPGSGYTDQTVFYSYVLIFNNNNEKHVL